MKSAALGNPGKKRVIPQQAWLPGLGQRAQIGITFLENPGDLKGDLRGLQLISRFHLCQIHSAGPR